MEKLRASTGRFEAQGRGGKKPRRNFKEKLWLERLWERKLWLERWWERKQRPNAEAFGHKKMHRVGTVMFAI